MHMDVLGTIQASINDTNGFGSLPWMQSFRARKCVPVLISDGACFGFVASTHCSAYFYI